MDGSTSSPLFSHSGCYTPQIRFEVTELSTLLSLHVQTTTEYAEYYHQRATSYLTARIDAYSTRCLLHPGLRRAGPLPTFIAPRSTTHI